MGKKEELIVYYDGSCPFCSNYVQMLELRSNYEVKLVSLRERKDVLERFKSMGLDVDEGMIVETGEDIFYAEDAIILLAKLDQSKNLYPLFVNVFFRVGFFPSIIYKVFKIFRKITLKVIGINMIN